MKLRKIQTDKKGAAMDVLVWMVIVTIIVLFFGLWLYLWNEMTAAFSSIPSTARVNISNAASKTL